MRLQKYLAECGVASRRGAERIIESGRVRVNGAVAQVGCQVAPEQDEILVDGQPLIRNEKVYILLNKPSGVVTTACDTHGRPTVLKCLHGVDSRVFPVGRLDMDVEGALLLTNDGELANRLLHPKYGVEKVYRAWVYGEFAPIEIRKLEEGVRLEDGVTAPARLRIIKTEPNATLVQLAIREGRKREVKRMLAAVRHPVKSLRRTAFAGLEVRDLRPGDWRYLHPGEIGVLRRLAGF